VLVICFITSSIWILTADLLNTPLHPLVRIYRTFKLKVLILSFINCIKLKRKINSKHCFEIFRPCYCLHQKHKLFHVLTSAVRFRPCYRSSSETYTFSCFNLSSMLVNLIHIYLIIVEVLVTILLLLAW
jgi:hypothetical protein